MDAKRGWTRRDFLANSGKGAATLGTAAAMAAARTARAARGAKGANDRIVIGVIGSGGRGTDDANTCCTASNVVCGAVCDLAKFRRENATKALTATMGFKGHPDAKIAHHVDYRELLDRKEIDAVVIATPDVWHHPPFMAAIEAGKHVYQEKPFSYRIDLGLEMVSAARKRPELTVQVGTQRRSGDHYAKAKAFIDEGKLGDVRFVRTFDCRNWANGNDPFVPKLVKAHLEGKIGRKIDWKEVDWAKFEEPCRTKSSFDPWRYTAWRWFWVYAGGLVTDVGVHVMDNVHWLLGEPTPKSAVCHGGVYALKYWQTPDVVNAVWDYGKFTVTFTSNFCNGFEGDGFIIYGTKGTMECRGNDVKVWAEGDRERKQPVVHWTPEGVAHQHDWINCIRSGERTHAPVELGHSSLLPSHLANLAYREGARIGWDPVEKKAKVI